MSLYPEGTGLPGPGPDKQVVLELKSIAESLKSIARSQSEISHFIHTDLKKFVGELLRKMPPPPSSQPYGS